MKVFHIENHTSKEGRGKGCAWIYVTNAEDEAKLISLNRRLYIDVDSKCREGVWYVTKAMADDLNEISNAHSVYKNRPLVLPRQPLVCEKPAIREAPAPAPRARWAETRREVSTGATPMGKMAPTSYGPRRIQYRHDPYAFNPLPKQFRSESPVARQ